MKTTKIIAVTVGITVLAILAAVMVVKARTPQVKDAYFDPDTDKLRLLPVDLVAVRPTHFPAGTPKVRRIQDGDGEILTRTLGRNVSLQDVIAEGWDCNPARVVLPPDAPKGGYDFLVTTIMNTREHLQTAIRKTLGYAARRETRKTEVWVLKVENADLPGMTVSPDNEKTGMVVKDGRLYFKHQTLKPVVEGMSQGLKQPVVDETGLSQFYDFSVVWNPEITQRMQAGTFNLEGVRKVLGSWGLKLEPDTQSVDMYVVEKAR